MKLKKINLYFGLTLFVGFLLTGYYMENYFKLEHIDNLVMRMQIRASHIYILFISFLNVMAFKFNLKSNNRFSGFLEIMFRVLIIASGILAVFAFLKEHTGDLEMRNSTRYAVILSTASVGLILLNELVHLMMKKKSI